MELLYVILVLLPIALVILLIAVNNRMARLFRELEDMRQRMVDMGIQLRQFSRGPGTSSTPFPSSVAAPAPPAAPPTPQQEMPASPSEPLVDTPWEPPVAAEPVSEPVLMPERPEPTTTDATPPPRPIHVPVPEPEPQLGFFERHPDLERFIGENLINKIGITVLVIGIGLMMKYAIDKDLISETGRILIGLACGGILVFFAHRVRTDLRAFSSVLVAGGITVFYFSIALAFHEYQLIGQTAAFAIMVLITALAVLLTLAYDRKELAIIALLGGFATPFMVSTGEGNFRVLFTYLLILNVGMLVLAGYKKWHVINIIAFVLTLLLFGGWALGEYPDMVPKPWIPGFAFATAFFGVFFGMNLRYNLRHRTDFGHLDLSLLVVNAAAYYGVGMHLIGHVQPKITGLFTVLIGLFHLGFAIYFHKRQGSPRILRLLLIGLVLTFISLAAPVQLEGSHITLFWAAESVLLLWFAQRSGLWLVERGAFAVLGLMLVSLILDLDAVYGPGAQGLLSPVINKGFTTGMVAVVALVLLNRLLQRSPADHHPVPGLSARLLQLFAASCAVVLLYLIVLFELRYQLGRIWNFHVVNLALMAWSLSYLLALDAGTRRVQHNLRVVVAMLMAGAAICQVALAYSDSRAALNSFLTGSGGAAFVVLHYLGFALVVGLVVRIALLARVLIAKGRPGWTNYLWVMCVYLVILASQQLDIAMLLALKPDAEHSYLALAAMRRVGYPLLWGCGSFLIMWYGMQQRMRTLRVIALVLFAITLLKLFLIDLGNLSEGGRVASFILLGVLLLVISFMYQRLKGLLKEDTEPEAPTGTSHLP